MDSAKEQSSIWPPEINAEYEKVRPLGEGAYGIVWLAKAKNFNTAKSSTHNDDDDDSIEDGEKEDTFITDSSHHANNYTDHHPQYVAIKQITAGKDSEKQYAAREIAILKEINHPNIVRCLQSVDMPKSRLVVLTLADGPDMGDLVSVGGALSVNLVRLAARHLISAVAYLHGRGVIHRDIKPNNCILERVDASAAAMHSNKDDWQSNDRFWDDKATFDEKEWKVVLVDFGFARALTEKECGGSRNRASVRTLVDHGIAASSRKLGGDLDDSKHSTSSKTKESSSSSSEKRSGMRRGSSIQRMPIRAMSALGTRAFAAPEVTQARRKTSSDVNALSENVSDYGLISDAYSVGVTIRLMLTGVPAGENEMEFMSAQDNILMSILSLCCKSGDGGRKKRYKWLDETPKPARELVKKLTKSVFDDRLTVPMARDEPWIKGGISNDDPVIELPVGDIQAGNDDPIVCLTCAGNVK